MTVTIEIPSEIEALVRAEVDASGVELRQFVSDVLIDHFEETADRRVANSRLEVRQVPITANQLYP